MSDFEELPGVWETAVYGGDAGNYLASNPDVAADAYFSARPLEHYERFGKGEGRAWGAPAETGGGGGGWAPAPQDFASATPQQESKPRPVAPAEIKLPSLDMSQASSPEYQMNRLLSLDSLPMQQAKVDAQEKGVASGAIHSSQQAGAAQRAVTDKIMPLASAEANLVGGEDIANWTNEVKQETQRYERQYAVYLAELGFENQQQIAMTQANTSLSTALMSSMTSLMGNPEIEFGEEVKNKLTSIYNGAMQNNNTILDMGFSYA